MASSHSSNNNNINNQSSVGDSSNNNNSNNKSLVNDSDHDSDKGNVDNTGVEGHVEEVAVTDGNNNNAGQGEQPDGAIALPDDDIVMVDVNKRSLANEIVRAIELTEEQMLASPNPRDWYREWFRVWLPDGEDGLLDLGRDTTVAMVNERLDQEFGPGAMFLGLQFGDEIVPATSRMTMEELVNIGVDLAIGFGTENWYEGD